MKKFLIAIGVLLTTGIAIFVFIIGRGLNRLAEEDHIVHRYFPVVNAIYDYCEKNHIAPATLENLTPVFLSTLPSNVQNTVVSYIKMDDQTNWIFSVTTDMKTRNDRWTYFYSSLPEAQPPGNMERIGYIHTWAIYKKK